MAIPGGPEAARFFVGVLAAGPGELELAGGALADEFGMPDSGSRLFPFADTGYYRDELGDAPVRAFLSFPGRFDTFSLAGAKAATNRLEGVLAGRIAGGLPRPVNLDPGYVTLAKLVLASAKNFAHRVCIAPGYYAEVTLQYRGRSFRALPWTFPDYASGRYDAFFLQLRGTLTHEAGISS